MVRPGLLASQGPSVQSVSSAAPDVGALPSALDNLESREDGLVAVDRMVTDMSAMSGTDTVASEAGRLESEGSGEDGGEGWEEGGNVILLRTGISDHSNAARHDGRTIPKLVVGGIGQECRKEDGAPGTSQRNDIEAVPKNDLLSPMTR